MSLGLAPIIVERLLPVVATYARESGCALLLVEQHIEIALAVADRGYVLSHGELVMHDSAEVLGADHQLILSSYLGGVDGPASASTLAADRAERPQ